MDETRRERLRAALDHLHAGRPSEAAGIVRPYAATGGEAGLLLGLALGMLGDLGGSAELLARAAAAKPDEPHPVRALAHLLRRAGRGQETATHLIAALERRPDDPWIGVSIAEMLLDDGHHEAAAEQAGEVLRARPDFASALNAYGEALAQLGEVQAAADQFRRATVVAPGLPAGWSNLGKACAALGRAHDAEAALARAAALAPDDPQVGLNRAAALLRFGCFDAGWAALEARHGLPGRVVPPGPRLPGLEGAAGRTVLLWHEEGFGDTLQFIRYATPLAERGARVVAWVPYELRRLVAGVAGVSEAVAERPDAYDWHVPLISLPGLFGTDVLSVPQHPYLVADPTLTSVWRTRLSDLRGLRVGVTWAGGARPWDPSAVTVDRARSATLEALLPLGAVPGVALVSLQAGPRAHDAAPPGMALYRPMREGQDFAETAAVVANLDAVVSVDTAVAHLAGGMGKPLLLLDRWDPCWRWGHGQDTSPWYPSMRIMRQDRPGDWTGPVRRVAAALAGLAAR